MSKIHTGISLMPNTDFLRAIFPLLEKEVIEIIEWSFDMTLANYTHPKWVQELLDTYSNHSRLIGHGVHYSLFDAKWDERQINWLKHLKEITTQYHFNHITEHFGFMSSGNYHKSIPLPVTLSNITLEIGIDRLKRLQDTAQLPVGIENLALAFSIKDLKEQGDFLDKMMSPIDGFLILDLHNIYCQAHNFELDIMEVILSYPLERVKEIHVSGGSWQQSIYRKNFEIRRDTHDHEVPEIIFEILPTIIPLCKHLDVVILERLGETFPTLDSFENFKDEYLRLHKIVSSFNVQAKKEWKTNFEIEELPITSISLYEEQQKLAHLLLTEPDISKISNTNFQHWNSKTWNLEMINTARNISLKWDSN